MPGPKFNLNSVRNGRRIVRLVVGELPGRLDFIKREARAYRVALEETTADVHGEVDLVAAHAIDTASASQQHAAVCRWIMRHRFAEMTTADLLACSREMVLAKERRDRAVNRLQLGKSPTDPLDALYIDSEPTQGPNLEPEEDNPMKDSEEQQDLEIAREKARAKRNKHTNRKR